MSRFIDGDLPTLTPGGFSAWANAVDDGAALKSISVQRGPRTLRLNEMGGAPDLDVDSTQAVEDALDYAALNPGTVIEMPGGEEPYRVTVGALELPADLTWRGDGPASRLIGDYGSTQQSMLRNDWANGASGITLANWLLDRSGANTQHGALLNGVDDLLLDGWGVVGATPDIDTVASGALSISGVGPSTRIASRNVVIRGFVGREVNNFGVHFGTLDGVTIDGYDIHGFRELIGIEPEPGEECRGVVIGAGRLRQSVTGVGSVTGMLVATVSSGGTFRDWRVGGPVVITADAAATAASPGVNILGAVDGQVSGVTCVGLPGRGVSIGSADYTVAGVRVGPGEIIDCGGAGIALRRASDCTVSGMAVRESGTYGVEELAGCARNLIVECDLRDNPSGPYLLASSTSRARGNRVTDSVRAQMPSVGYGLETASLPARVGDQGLRITSISITAATNVVTLTDRYGATGMYMGEVLVIGRSNDTGSANTAVYKLIVGKHAANSGVIEVAKQGLLGGSGGSWPSFTWSLDTGANALVATPIGSTSGSFDLHIQVQGDLLATEA